MRIKIKGETQGFLFRLCLMLLVITALNWRCSSWKHRISNKERASHSRQVAEKEQSLFMERQERELMNYFGESAILVLPNGFRFHPDSGLMGKSALLHYKSTRLATARQQDSSVVAYDSEKHQKEKAQLKTKKTEKQKRSAVKYWWVLLLIPVFWMIKKRRR